MTVCCKPALPPLVSLVNYPRSVIEVIFGGNTAVCVMMAPEGRTRRGTTEHDEVNGIETLLAVRIASLLADGADRVSWAGALTVCRCRAHDVCHTLEAAAGSWSCRARRRSFYLHKELASFAGELVLAAIATAPESVYGSRLEAPACTVFLRPCCPHV